MGSCTHRTPISVPEILVFTGARRLVCEKRQAIAAAAERKKDERHASIQQFNNLLCGIPIAYFHHRMQ
jgi:hypothetical protein